MEEEKKKKEKTRHIKIWIDDDVVDQFEFDFDEKMSNEDVEEVVYQYVYDNLKVEVR